MAFLERPPEEVDRSLLGDRRPAEGDFRRRRAAAHQRVGRAAREAFRLELGRFAGFEAEVAGRDAEPRGSSSSMSVSGEGACPAGVWMRKPRRIVVAAPSRLGVRLAVRLTVCACEGWAALAACPAAGAHAVAQAQSKTVAVATVLRARDRDALSAPRESDTLASRGGSVMEGSLSGLDGQIVVAAFELAVQLSGATGVRIATRASRDRQGAGEARVSARGADRGAA